MEWIQTLDHTLMKGIQGISRFGPAIMDPIFAAFTFLGEETFLIAAVLVVYWALDKRRGEYLLLSLYTAAALNGVVKDVVRRPRPFQNPAFRDARYVVIDTPLVDTAGLGDSFSFPSGHAQSSSSFFSALAFSHGRRKIGFWAGLAVVLVMISRVYLGVHYPSDVIAGAFMGLAVSAVCWALYQQFYHARLVLFGASLGLAACVLLLDYTPGSLKTLGLGLGAFLGLLIEHRWVRFRVEGSLMGKILRVALGLALIIGVRLGLKTLFPAGILWDALRYGCVGLMATGIWPWFFHRLGM